MNTHYAYTFLAGLFIGGYTNFFSKLVISGLVLYIVHPDNFNVERFQPLYQRVCDKTHPYISKIYRIEDEEMNKKVEILPSPIPIKALPKLHVINK